MDKPKDLEEIDMAYLETEDPTPVQNAYDSSLLQYDDEEKTPIITRWWVELLDYLIAKLTDAGIETLMTFDEYREPCLIISWQNSKLAHVRLLIGNDDDEPRTKYITYSFGLQGPGSDSLRKHLDSFDLKAMDEVFYDTLAFKRLCDTLMS